MGKPWMTEKIVVATMLIIIFIFFIAWDLNKHEKWWGSEENKKTLSTTRVSFWDLGVVIDAQTIQSMSQEELVNYAILLYYIDRFNTSKPETMWLGVKLLPRFFKLPKGQTLQETHSKEDIQ